MLIWSHIEYRLAFLIETKWIATGFKINDFLMIKLFFMIYDKQKNDKQKKLALAH